MSCKDSCCSAAFLTEDQANDTVYTNARIHAINIGHAQKLQDVTECHNCKKRIKRAKEICAGCRSRFYCSNKCRKKDYKSHRLVCPDHDALGLSTRFVPSPLGLISLTDHPLYKQATEVVELEDGLPCAIWAVPPGQTFGQILKRVCGEFVIVDPSLYAQLMILAENWTPERDRFSIFTGGGPVSAQLEVFKMPYETAITLIPKHPDVMRAFGFCQGKTTLDHFQGPRQIELLRDNHAAGEQILYRGLTRFSGPVRMELHEWGDVASDELFRWSDTVLQGTRPNTLGTESTWNLNKVFAQSIHRLKDDMFEWKAIINGNPPAETDEEEQDESDDDLDLDAAEHLGYLTLDDVSSSDDDTPIRV